MIMTIIIDVIMPSALIKYMVVKMVYVRGLYTHAIAVSLHALMNNRRWSSTRARIFPL